MQVLVTSGRFNVRITEGFKVPNGSRKRAVGRIGGGEQAELGRNSRIFLRSAGAGMMAKSKHCGVVRGHSEIESTLLYVGYRGGSTLVPLMLIAGRAGARQAQPRGCCRV